MGKNKDKKKKGKGMEKTLAKTEKKNQKRMQKELEELGEENIEKLIAEFKEKDKQLTQIKEEECAGPPSPRSGASFNLLVEKDEFVLFGGEYYNGSKIFMYNDLYFYNIKKNQWSQLKIPSPPPPRSSHQAVTVSRNQGELWVFGGEFASPSQSQFYHYNDLWVLRFQTKQWERINAPNGPSPRSGHRMIVLKKHLVVFGGFHDNLKDCRYFNDTYLFDLETNQWQELKFSSISEIPSPRSACQLSVSNKHSYVVLYGGYSKEKLKKDKEKGIIHTDMFILSQETKKDGKAEWLWKKVKQTGAKPSERCSFSMITLLDDTALLFGGVYDYDNPDDDDEDDENMKSIFYNDLYKLDLSSFKWMQVKLKGKKKEKKLKPKKSSENSDKQPENAEISISDDEDDAADDNDEEKMDLSSTDTAEDIQNLSLKENNVFELHYNEKACDEKKIEDSVVVINQVEEIPFSPIGRRSAYLQLYKGTLYLYSGCYEGKNGKELTLVDMYSINTKKFDEWKTLIEDKSIKAIDLERSNQSSSDSEEDDEDDDDDDDDDSEMEIDAPELEDTETLNEYFTRTKEFWLTEAKKEFPGENSKKTLRMANELCNLFYENLKKASKEDK